MAKRTTTNGVRGITGDNGYGWLPGDGGSWVRSDPDGPTYVLEKRNRNQKDGCPDTGWYLYDDQPGGYFGEWCARNILDAVDAANRLIEKDGTPTKLPERDSTEGTTVSTLPDPISTVAEVISAAMELETDPNSERCRTANLIFNLYADRMADHPEFDRAAFKEACKPSWMRK